MIIKDSIFSKMLTLKTGSDSVIIVLHEIYGINQHISGVCEKYYSAGYDVYCPNLLDIAKPFCYMQQEEAYAYFINNVGFEICFKVNQLLEQIRPYYKRIILLGYSIGATIAWICAEKGLCDGIIGYYGSRIRDYLTMAPKCPSLLLFASQEASFSAESVVKAFKNTSNITARVLSGSHGFCDPFSGNFHPASATKAEKLTQKFIEYL